MPNLPVWPPRHACQPTVLKGVTFIRDSLLCTDLVHVIEQAPENTDVFLCGAMDRRGFTNVGLIGWDRAAARVRFFAHDPERNCWWDARDEETFLSHLTGEVREIVEKAERQLREIAEQAAA